VLFELKLERPNCSSAMASTNSQKRFTGKDVHPGNPPPTIVMIARKSNKLRTYIQTLVTPTQKPPCRSNFRRT